MKVIDICRRLAKLPPETEVSFLNDDGQMVDFEIRTIRDDLDDNIYTEEEVLDLIAEGVIATADDIYIQILTL